MGNKMVLWSLHMHTYASVYVSAGYTVSKHKLGCELLPYHVTLCNQIN